MPCDSLHDTIVQNSKRPLTIEEEIRRIERISRICKDVKEPSINGMDEYMRKWD
jgi:hypothetical protein